MRRLAIISLLMLSSLCARGQADSLYDSALDRYEGICNRITRLRTAQRAGKQVPETEVKRLAYQVSGLRKTLSEADGYMSDDQRVRFAVIRDRFVLGNVLGRVEAGTFPVYVNGGCLPSSLADQEVLPVPEPAPLRVRVSVMPLAAYVFSPAQGFMFGGHVGVNYGRTGLYIKGFSDFSSGAYSYVAGDGFWPNGVEHRSGWCVVGGLSYRIVGPLGVYAGAGYASRSFIREDMDGARALVNEASCKGVAVDLGLTLSMEKWPVSFIAGVSFVPWKMVAVSIGAGLYF